MRFNWDISRFCYEGLYGIFRGFLNGGGINLSIILLNYNKILN